MQRDRQIDELLRGNLTRTSTPRLSEFHVKSIGAMHTFPAPILYGP
jgi:hypothetical protein